MKRYLPLSLFFLVTLALVGWGLLGQSSVKPAAGQAVGTSQATTVPPTDTQQAAPTDPPATSAPTTPPPPTKAAPAKPATRTPTFPPKTATAFAKTATSAAKTATAAAKAPTTSVKQAAPLAPPPVNAPDLGITVTATPGVFTINTVNNQFNITVTNGGTLPTTDPTIKVFVTLPPGLATAAVNAGGWNCPASQLDINGKPKNSTQTFTCTFTGILPQNQQPGNSTLLVLPVNQVAAWALGNPPNNFTVQILPAATGDTNQANDTASIPVNITGYVDLTVSQTHTPSGSWIQGVSNQTFTVQALNQGTGDAPIGTVSVNGSILTVPPPNGTGMTIHPNGVSGTGWTCSAAATTWVCTNAVVMVHGVALGAISVIVDANAVGSYTSEVVVSDISSEPPVLVDNLNTSDEGPVVVNAPPQLTLTKVKTSAAAIVNETVGWKITLNNAALGGPTNGQTTVTDNLQTGLTIASVTPPTGWDCSASVVGGNLLSCFTTTIIVPNSNTDFVFTTTVGGPVSLYPNGISNGASVVTVIGPNGQQLITTLQPALFYATVQFIDASLVTKSHTGTLTSCPTGPQSQCFVADSTGTIVQTWIVAIHNNGTANILSGSLKYTDTLPSGILVAAPPTTSGGATWNCGATLVGTAAVSCVTTSDLTTVNPDTSITVRVKVPPAAYNANVNHTVTNSGEKVLATFDSESTNDNGPSDTVTVLGADLVVTKTSVPQGVLTASVQAKYIITVQNVGNAPNTSTSTSITDVLPQNFTYDGGSGTNWTCPGTVPPITTITCTYNQVLDPAVNSGKSSDLTILVTPTSAATNAVNQVSVINPDDVNTGNNSFSLGVVVNPAPTPDLNITKDHGNPPTNFEVSTAGHFFLHVTNVGSAATSGGSTTHIIDDVPGGSGTTGFTVTAVTVTASSGPALFTCPAPVVNPSSTHIDCSYTGVIAAGTIVYKVDIAVTPKAAGNWSNTATVSTNSNPGDNDPGNDTANDSGTIVLAPAADLQPFITHPSGFVRLTANEFDVQILNVGSLPTNGAQAVTKISIDPRFSISAVTPSAPTTCTTSGNLVTCNTINNGITTGNTFASVVISVTPQTLGAFTSSAIIQPTGGGGENNFANDAAFDNGTITSSPQPDMTIFKTHSGNFTLGVQSDYTITVQNIGSQATNGSTITVTDTLPTGLSYTASSGTGWTCPTPTVPSQTTVTCTMTGIILDLGQVSNPLTISVTPTASGTLTNKAHVSISQTESSLANNDASDPTFVNGAFDLTITKSHSPSIFVANAPFNTQSYTLLVTNKGTIPTTSGATITVTDQLDPALGAVSASGNPFTCNIATGLMTCTTINQLFPNTPVAITVFVNPTTSPASFTNVANISINAAENNIGNNQASDPTTIANGPLADIALTMSHSGGFVAGGTGTWLVTLTNVGTATYSGAALTVTDTLPGANVTLASASGSGWSCPIANPLVCTGPTSLAASGSTTIAIVVNVTGPAGQSVTNSATTPHILNDPTNTDESASDTATIVSTPPISNTNSKISVLTTQLVNNGNITFHEITVNVRDTSNQPMQGVLIALTPSTTLGGFLIVNPSAGYSTLTTDQGGNVFFDLSSTQAGSVTFSATANNIAIQNTVTVNFGSSTGINTGNSSCTVGTSSLAVNTSGSTTNQTTVSIIVRDNSNNGINGVSVLLNRSVSGTDTSTFVNSPNPNTTSGSGNVSFIIAAGTTNETITFTANLNSGQATLNCNQTLTIGSGGTGTTTGLSGTVTSDTVSLPDDNLHFATITVNLKNNGTGYASRHIVLNPSPTMAGFSSQPAPNAVTDASGNTSFTVRSTSQGAVTLTAVDSDDNFTIGSVTVTFTAVGTVQVYSTTGVTSTTGAPTGPTGPTQGYVITRLLCIRQGPGFGYKRFPTGLRFRTVVTVLGRASRVIFPAVRDGCIHKGGPTWFYIQLADGSKMWANATYIRVPLAGFRGLPVLPAPPLPAAPGA